MPGTVEDAAAEVTRSGGDGLPWRCDHCDAFAVRDLAQAIEERHGSLDVLVNNTWAGYERLNARGWKEWNAPFFEQPVELVDSMLRSGVMSHYLTASACAGLRLRRPPRAGRACPHRDNVVRRRWPPIPLRAR